MKSRQQSISVYFMVPSPPGIAPGQRFRFEHYLPLLAEKGINYTIGSYFSREGRSVLYSRSNTWRKIAVILRGYIKRLLELFVIWRYDYIYIHKEATPVGPAIFPWVAAKIFRKKIIYDFDDAIWTGAMSKYNKRFSFLKSFGNVSRLCKWSYTVTVGNAYLKSYADQYNKNVIIIPTVVNTETGHNILQDQDTTSPAVGWTGSFSTLKYLEMVLPVLQRLQERIDFTFYVIADKDPQLPLKNYRFIQWNIDTEINDLLHFHIGIMPLLNDEFSKGKCGFKAIQYMALGMPALVSPVGVNTAIVDDGKNGYVCDTAGQWEQGLTRLLNDPLLRKQLGRAAREKIETAYSVKATEELFMRLFTDNKN